MFKILRIFRPGKKFGSGQLILENWSGGPVDGFFFEPQPKFSKSKECLHADMDAEQRWQPVAVRCWMSGARQTRGMEKAGCWRVERSHKSL